MPTKRGQPEASKENENSDEDGQTWHRARNTFKIRGIVLRRPACAHMFDKLHECGRAEVWCACEPYKVSTQKHKQQ